ncbi:hypothetical protein BG015_009404 [Linnemannia schmuckeri]|uniref:C2H2-type domain-containing protein n=1 Tax=Linnemannia schmuckeri TaxID=64567 RepID=A0A9P5RVL1_9FUNG|nr:hypothetical protein BG015_009404 [Linnemannia schmuckeri]
MATAASYHQRYRPGQGTSMDKCNTWPSNPEGLPMTTMANEGQSTPVHANNSNVPFAPILFQGETVMALPAQWVFAHLTPSRVDQFVTTEDLLRSTYQTTPPPPLLMLPASTASMGLGSIASSGGGNGSLMVVDPLAEYESGARLEAQGRATDMSLDIAMAMQDQRPMYFVLSRFQPPNVTHVGAVPLPSMPPPQPTEEHLHDMLMVPDIYTMDNLPRDDSISMGAFHGAGMTISPADTMNSPLHSSLTPTMAALSAAKPNMIGSPYLSTKDEPGEGEGCDYDDYDDENEPDDNDNEMDEDDDNDIDKNDRSSSIDNTTANDNDNDNDAKLKSKRNECSVCHKTFTRRSNLKTHERLHTRTHAVACPLCGCTFSRQPDLNRHLLAIHEGARSHSCDKCGRSFSRKDAWRVHQTSCRRNTPQLE